jgi:hypothetical protein
VPSAAVVTAGVRALASSSFVTSAGVDHGEPAVGAVALRSPSIGEPDAKNKRSPPGTARRAGSADNP